MNCGISCVCHIFRINPVSFPYHFRIVSVSFPYRFRIILLSSSYCEAENNTETIRNRTNDERMRIGGTRVVHLTIIVNSYDNGKTQTNYLGVKMSLSTTTKSDKFIHKKSRILNTLPFRACIIGGTSAIQASLIAFGLHDNSGRALSAAPQQSN